MNGTAYADEKEIFAQLMQEYIRSYGEELLRRNEELKREAVSSVSALAYVRCRELIRREFAAIRRRNVLKGVRISSAAACAVLVLATAAVMLVPPWHDAVIGRSETVVLVASPEQRTGEPSYRRNMPPIVTPEPEETDDPASSTHQIMSKDYIIPPPTPSPEPEMASQSYSYSGDHIIYGRPGSSDPTWSGGLTSSGSYGNYGFKIDGYYPDMTPPGPTSAINVQPNTGRRSDMTYHDLPPGTYVIGNKTVVKIFPG